MNICISENDKFYVTSWIVSFPILLVPIRIRTTSASPLDCLINHTIIGQDF